MRTKPLQGIGLLAAALATVCLGAAGQTSPPTRDLAIGQHAPSFTLKDQNDNEVSLDALLKKGPVAVVFLRSAHWCNFCQLQLIQMQKNLKEIEASGGRVVAISYDAPQKLKMFADRRKMTMPLLSDTGSKIIDAYDMRSEVATGNQVGCARHGTFILDQKGIIRSKPNLVSYEERPLVEALVNALKEAQNQKGESKL